MKLIAVAILALVLLLLLAGCASADTGGTWAEQTSVWQVRPYNARSGYSYCDLRLSNGRTLTYVYGAECHARPGQAVTLLYRYERVCKLWWCTNSRFLVDWWLR